MVLRAPEFNESPLKNPLEGAKIIVLPACSFKAQDVQLKSNILLRM